MDLVALETRLKPGHEVWEDAMCRGEVRGNGEERGKLESVVELVAVRGGSD